MFACDIYIKNKLTNDNIRMSSMRCRISNKNEKTIDYTEYISRNSP